jgi:hypothetical protein
LSSVAAASPVRRAERLEERSIDGKWVVERPAFGLELRADLACFGDHPSTILSGDLYESVRGEKRQRGPDLAVSVREFPVGVGLIGWLITHGLGLLGSSSPLVQSGRAAAGTKR